MSRKARAVFLMAVAFSLVIAGGERRAIAQDSAPADTQKSPAAPQTDSEATPQDNSGKSSTPSTSGSDAKQKSNGANTGADNGTNGASAQTAPGNSAKSQKPALKPAPERILYPLTQNYSVSLSTEWSATSLNTNPPPAALSSYAPFQLSGNLVLANTARGAVLQFAISNNPFIGHDSYWLDTQMHAPSSSGMSLIDFFFYYFFPPSEACMHQILTTDAAASRVSPMEGPAYMQVYYSCPLSDTLSDFYAGQVSAGVTFQLTDNGTRVLAPVGNFYVAPMEQVEESDMTFFVFEAQGMNEISSDAAARFHLPANVQGGQPDFFWAIGAASPFPFVADSARGNVPILHVAYARIGADADAKAEFMNILREVRVH